MLIKFIIKVMEAQFLLAAVNIIIYISLNNILLKKLYNIENILLIYEC
jgi:hypothetical protein